MCFSPQPTSQNGSAFAITPSTIQRRQEARSSVTARAAPIECARYPKRMAAAIAARAHISGAGSKPPSTATLMKR